MRYEPVLPGYGNYLRDESRLEGRADNIVFPEDTAGAAEAVRKAAAENWRVTVQGARTGITGGAVPNGGLILNVEKMNKPLGCRPAASGVPLLRVQAGMTFEMLHSFLGRGIADNAWTEESKNCFENAMRQTRRRFTPNPTETSAALGGAFACNAKGPNALRYGGTGAHVQAITWVTPRGEIWEIERGHYCFDTEGCPLPDGSRLNIDTSIGAGACALLHPRPGLDLIDFLAGSEGLAGIVTGLDLRLEPLPEVCWAVIYFFTNETTAAEFGQTLSRWMEASPNGKYLSSVEYYDSSSLDIVRRGAEYVSALKQLPAIKETYREAVHIELEGGDAQALEAALMEQLAFFTGAGGGDDDTWAAADWNELEKYRLLRHGVPELINTEVDRIRRGVSGFCKTAADFMVSPAEAADWEKRYHHDIEKAGLRGFVFGHILEGHLHVNLLTEHDLDLPRCHELLESWAKSVSDAGGLLAAENGVGKLKKNLVLGFLAPQRRGQISSILSQLDPAGLFGGFEP